MAALAGCVETFEEPCGPGEHVGQTAGVEGWECYGPIEPGEKVWEGVPSWGLLFEGLVEDGWFTWKADMVNPCAIEPNYFSYWMYDRHGLVDEVVHVLPLEKNVSLKIPVTGEGPWLFTGDRPRCMESFTAEATGVLNATTLGRLGESYFVSHEDHVPVFIPKGESIGTATYDAPPFAIRLSQMGPWGEREGHRHGTITVYDTFGQVNREDTYPIEGGGGTVLYGYSHIAGGWTIELELPFVAALDTTWYYVFEYPLIGTDICNHGYEWDLCV